VKRTVKRTVLGALESLRITGTTWRLGMMRVRPLSRSCGTTQAPAGGPREDILEPTTDCEIKGITLYPGCTLGCRCLNPRKPMHTELPDSASAEALYTLWGQRAKLARELSDVHRELLCEASAARWKAREIALNQCITDLRIAMESK
jgi:hypothetical protein